MDCARGRLRDQASVEELAWPSLSRREQICSCTEKKAELEQPEDLRKQFSFYIKIDGHYLPVKKFQKKKGETEKIKYNGKNRNIFF